MPDASFSSRSIGSGNSATRAPRSAAVAGSGNTTGFGFPSPGYDPASTTKNPLPKFSPPRRVPHGVALLGRLFEEGTVARAGLALERAFSVASERPPGF